MTAPGDTQANGPQPSTIVTIPRAIHYATQQISPPSYLHIQQEDDILVKVFAPTIALPFSVNIEFRVLYPPSTSQPEAEIRPTRKTVLVNATSVTLRFNLNEGHVLSASASMAAGATAQRGQVFVQLFVVRGIASDLITLWTLLSDYVTTNFRPTWPNAGPRGPLEGPGFFRLINGANPAAGAEDIETVPAGVRWRPISFYTNLTTSGAVANRLARIALTNGVNTYYVSTAYFTQTAGTFSNYCCVGMTPGASIASNVVNLPLPPTPILLATHSILTSTSNIQAADQWAAPNYMVEEWIDI